MKNLILGLMLLILGCKPKPVSEDIQKLDNDFHLKDTLLKTEAAKISIESKKASIDIAENKKAFKKAVIKLKSDSMPAEIKADVDTLLTVEAKKDSSFEHQIAVDSTGIKNLAAQLALEKNYSEGLHSLLIAKDDSLQMSKAEVSKLKAKVKRKNWRILEAFGLGAVAGTVAVLK